MGTPSLAPSETTGKVIDVRRRASRSGSVESGGARPTRAAMLAGASLVALAMLDGPDAALACTGQALNLSGFVAGPVVSLGGNITVGSTATVMGNPQGVYAPSCAIPTLTNNGAIGGHGSAIIAVPGGSGVESASGVGIGSSTTRSRVRSQAVAEGRALTAAWACAAWVP